MRFYLIIICFLITGAALGQQITDAIEPEGGERKSGCDWVR